MVQTLAVQIKAPAKLNLLLRIVGRRADGYHKLQTLYQLIDYTDLLEITARNDAELIGCDETGAALSADNLCLQAAGLMRGQHKTGRGAVIVLHKRIAIGAGLGGGSSDAAAVLVGLNRLWGEPFTTAQLAEWGLQLGADVPLFVGGRTAWAEGIGERLVPVSRPPGYALVVPTPTLVSTAQAYQRLELTHRDPPITMGEVDAYWGTNVFESLQGAEVVKRLEWLKQQAPAALSGSGGSVFAWFDRKAAAQAVQARCPSDWQAVVARGLDRSPLYTAER